MCPNLLDTVFRRSSGAFVSTARARGIRDRAARTLEAAAKEVAPHDPTLILDSRTLFEDAATRAVVGDGGNLELSFGLVDELANTVEALGLARSSDVPDPFRRVWVSNGAGQRIRGVVLTCRAGEIAVFCPPAERSLAEIGSVLWLGYRGFTSSVEYTLQLDDSVRLPGALVLHLKRCDGSGEIGRSSVRHTTCLRGKLRLLDGGLGLEEAQPSACLVTDVSSGGMALSCALRFEQGARVRLDLPLPDEIDVAFTAEAVVRWSREGTPGIHDAGIAFLDLPRPRAERLERFLRTLPESADDGSHLPSQQLEEDSLAPDAPSSISMDTEARVDPREQTSAAAELSYEELRPLADERMDGQEPQLDEGPQRPAAPSEETMLERIFRRVSQAATSVSDHPFDCGDSRAERRQRRVAGRRVVHVSFKFALTHLGAEAQGCLLVPLPDALALASAYLMLPAADIEGNRMLGEPSDMMKQALLQLSELVASSVDRELRRATGDQARVRSLGCQGVRANVRPAFRYDEGAELLVGRSITRFAEFEPFELILMLPVLDLE